MRGLPLFVVALVALAGAGCLPPPIVRPPDIITGPVARTVPIFTATYPARCVDLGELETPIPRASGGEALAIKTLQHAAVATGGDALLLVVAALHPDHELRGRALQCGL